MFMYTLYCIDYFRNIVLSLLYRIIRTFRILNNRIEGCLMNFIKAFFQSESAGGISLLSAAILGVLVANSPMADQYFAIMQIHVGSMTILEWVNDALMALFFLYVGIEIKKEMISGELDTKAKRVLPVLGAFAGVITPAIVFYFVAGYMPEFRHGWGIPTATDIAFAIGVITMLGNMVSPAMKAFFSSFSCH